MSDPTRKDAAGALPELPVDWRLLLIDKGMKVRAFAGSPDRGASPPQPGLDLADYLAEEGVDLAEVGELLVCLEGMPPDCELRLRVGKPCLSIVARGFEDSKGVSCVVLRPTDDAQAERSLPAAWAWAVWTIRSLGLIRPSPADAPLQILIVDENPEVVTYGRTLSRKLGCRSSGAESGGAALALAKARPFDLVLIDSVIAGLGATALGDLIAERSKRDWGRDPMLAVMTPCDSNERGLKRHALEKPIALDCLREALKLAKEHRHAALVKESRGTELAVLNLEIWSGDQVLLRRLVQALVGQTREFLVRLGENASYPNSVDFMKNINSLKNGCDILHAYRLAAACQELLAVSQEPLSNRMRVKLDRLRVEIEGFRLFAAEFGLLQDLD